MARQRARRNRTLWLPLAMATIIGLGLVMLRSSSAEANEPAVRGDAEMTFCSKLTDTQCQPGVANINVSFTTRAPSIADLYDYDIPEQVRIRVQEVEIRLNTRADAIFGEEEQVLLYRDADNDGRFSEADVAIGNGLLKGKRILFEDINVDTEVSVADRRGSGGVGLFVVRTDGDFADAVIEDVDGPIKVQLFKDLAVKARDISANDAKIPVVEAVADLSLFDRTDAVSLSRSEFVESVPIFSAGADDVQVVVGPGDFELTDDVVVPAGLHLVIAPGTRFALGAGISFISYSPATIEGTAEAPIVIEPIGNEPFGVFGIIGAMDEETPTTLNYVQARGGSETEINGAFLSGMVSIYRSPEVRVHNSRFADAKADDGLNIKYGLVELTNNQFIANSADAFDGDFVVGEVRNNEFDANGNDSIDVSGSTLHVEGNAIRSSGDKGVSIGERSTVSVVRNLIIGSGIGIQAKDASIADVRENAILDSVNVGVDAYVKKAFFGPPSIEFSDNAIVANSPAISGLVPQAGLPANWTDGDPANWTEAQSWLGPLLEQR